MADYDPTQDSGTAYFCKIVLYDFFFWLKVILYMINDVNDKSTSLAPNK